MRVIELIETEAFNERENLKAIVARSPPKDGFTNDDLRKALKVLKRIDQPAGTQLRLENDEWQFLNDALARQRWSAAMQEIDDMVSKVMTAPDVNG